MKNQPDLEIITVLLFGLDPLQIFFYICSPLRLNYVLPNIIIFQLNLIGVKYYK